MVLSGGGLHSANINSCSLLPAKFKCHSIFSYQHSFIFNLKKSFIHIFFRMTAPTTCKDAIKKWEEQTGQSAGEAKEVILSFQWPPIERMDNNLSMLKNVEKLSLSTNMIEKIGGLEALRNLKILSLGRNNIKTFAGLEPIGAHLEQLWISYNLIEKIKGVNVFKALKVLYLGNNLVKDWAEFNRLQDIPRLEELILINNPICENLDTESWRTQVIRRLPKLKKLDGVPIVHLDN